MADDMTPANRAAGRSPTGEPGADPVPTAAVEPVPTAGEIRMAVRREQVAHLLARRLTEREIATALHVSERTVRYDVTHLRAEAARELSAASILDFAGEVVRATAGRERELWALFGAARGKAPRTRVVSPGTDREETITIAPGAPADPELQLRVLKELRANERHRLEALQSLGVVFKAPKALSFNLRVLALMGALPADQLARIADGDVAALEALLGADAAAALVEGPDRAPRAIPATVPVPVPTPSPVALTPGEVAVIPAPVAPTAPPSDAGHSDSP